MQTLTVESGGTRQLVRRWSPARSSDQVVVALHGVISHSSWFSLFAPALAALGATVLAPDRRGSGPGAAPLPPDCESWLSDLKPVFKLAADLGHLTVLGWSWGARLAIAAAAREPTIERVVLISPGLRMVSSVSERLAKTTALPHAAVPLPFDDDDFSEVESVRAFIRADTERWLTLPRPWLTLTRQMQLLADEKLPSLKQPMLVVLPEQDRMVDLAATRQLLAGRETIAMQGGHALILEQPEGAARCVAHWLGR